MTLATYLAAILGHAHGRQMNAETRERWQAEMSNSFDSKLDAPSWLWSSVVELLAIHEAAYLYHCQRYALSEAA